MTSTVNGAISARVDVLTAEVRALMIGSRQVTLSVYRQLDTVPPDQCVPFGRVRDSKDEAQELHQLFVVGRHATDGTLIRSSVYHQPYKQVIDPPLNNHTWWYEPTAEDAGYSPTYWGGGHSAKDACALIAEDGEYAVYCHLFPRNQRIYGRCPSVDKWDFKTGEIAEYAMQKGLTTIWAIKESHRFHGDWSQLPLIVLAGLR